MTENPLLNGTLFIINTFLLHFVIQGGFLCSGFSVKLAKFVVKFFVFDFVKVVLHNFSLTTLGYWKKKKPNQNKKVKKKKLIINE